MDCFQNCRIHCSEEKIKNKCISVVICGMLHNV